MAAVEIQGAIEGIKHGAKIARGMLDLKIAVEVQAKVIELNSIILGVQSDMLQFQESHAAALAQVKSLEEEIMRMKNMGAERERYMLHPVGSGAFAYVLKPSVDMSEPAHWLCVGCFDGGRKSVLQNIGRTERGREKVIKCGVCSNSFNIHWNARVARLTEEDIDKQKSRLAGEVVED